MSLQSLSHEVKNRRYRALQKMIADGDYFSESAMEKRCPDLYDYYIGRYLTNEEKEQKLREQASSRPSTLSEFFMDVIEKKLECEETEEDVQSEYEEEEEEEDHEQKDVPDLEKGYLAEEFRSRMYQRFLDGSDKEFEYELIDSNPEYDDVTQLERDAEDSYFDDEEPAGEAISDKKQTHDKESEDELDIYMKQLEKDVPKN